MVRSTLLRLTAGQRRSVISSLFTATFFASVATVVASQILPCPAHKRRAYFANNEANSNPDTWLAGSTRRAGEKKNRRWIEEKMPGA